MFDCLCMIFLQKQNSNSQDFLCLVGHTKILHSKSIFFSYFSMREQKKSRNMCRSFPILPSPHYSSVTQTSLKCKLWWLPVSTQFLKFDYRKNLAKNRVGMSLHQVAIDIAEFFCCNLILFKNNVAYWRIKLNGMHSVWVVFAN